MPEYSFTTTGGRTFPFSVLSPSKVPSFFVFSLPKSGSTLLMQMLAEVCLLREIPVVDLATEVFNLGIPPVQLTEDINTLWQSEGYAYLGFRSFFPTLDFDFSTTKNILLIREPKDILVSLYFSLKYSHVEPKKAGKDNSVFKGRKNLEKTSIDKAVLNMAPAYLKIFNDYLVNLPSETTRVYRYEDVIFKKREWLEDMVTFLGITIARTDINNIAQTYNIQPTHEDPKKHIRQVTPGNFNKHLQPATIGKLNELFAPIRERFCYDSVMSMSLTPQESSSRSLTIVDRTAHVVHGDNWRQGLSPIFRLLGQRLKRRICLHFPKDKR